MIQDQARQYFQAFANKDAAALRVRLAPNVSLRDWDQSVSGLDAVVCANQTIFDAVGTIAVTPLHIYVYGNTLIAELAIVIDGGDPLKVVDILEFDAQEKIFAVRAYKG